LKESEKCWAVGVVSSQNKTPLPKQERNERVATQEDPTVVSIPNVVRPAVVAIEPLRTVVVTLNVEHVEVAVRVGYVQNATYATTPRSLRDLEAESYSAS
jgi:hypothetical protein